MLGTAQYVLLPRPETSGNRTHQVVPIQAQMGKYSGLLTYRTLNNDILFKGCKELFTDQ